MSPCPAGCERLSHGDEPISSRVVANVLAVSTSESDYKDSTDADTLRCTMSSCAATESTVPIEGDASCGAEDLFVDSSEPCSTSGCTAQETVRPKVGSGGESAETVGADSRTSEETTSLHDASGDVLPFDRPLALETPAYDILEIVVSETLNTVSGPLSKADFTDTSPTLPNGTPPGRHRGIGEAGKGNIDEYVSNILVESLNSLTDQLESMNAAIAAPNKMSIIEKEIKVKLQNAGVNTIVHLSPTSNNQIIFGHAELCSGSAPSPAGRYELSSACDELPSTRKELPSVDSARELSSAESRAPVAPTPHVNRAVLQQIQKLFREDLDRVEPEARYTDECSPSISHVEVSNVDVYIDEQGASSGSTRGADSRLGAEGAQIKAGTRPLGGVGAANYYDSTCEDAIVPRFSAFPHTESMEVNTSSSDDAEAIGSGCTSLVDSLDDPNSPRSVMLRRATGGSRRSELVRSAIDVLDLLPEDAYKPESAAVKDKGESFFVTIKDDRCECDREKKDIVVAEHMPDTIKQRLYRRHKKRELRMECARRVRVKQLRREVEQQRRGHLRSSREETERECELLLDALLREIISKIAQDEIKHMRIKQKSVVMVSAKSESLSKKNKKKDAEINNNIKKISKAGHKDTDKNYHKEKFQIRGKLSLQTCPPLATEESNPKRIYQKSEIHDGKKCIEILEILEYISSSASSPETGNSDDSQSAVQKKSRIPVPVPERAGSQKTGKSGSCPQQQRRGGASPERPAAAAPVCESRSRSNSLRFRRVFDVIPEERVSASAEEARVLSTGVTTSSRISADSRDGSDLKFDTYRFNSKETRSVATSPVPGLDTRRGVPSQKSGLSPGNPLHRTAGTSPIRNFTMSTQTPLPRRKSFVNRQHNVELPAPRPPRPLRPPPGTARSCAPPLLARSTASAVPVE
ncbi:uncharacterized protein [Battus philenor]|uniref:uncharacterized protein n=1 Tax=Battus philenor TaxID=42288 RepID=UPI0035D05A9A